VTADKTPNPGQKDKVNGHQTMPNDRIKQQWDSLAALVMPPNVHPTQYTEMRRAFFGGARAMMTLMLEASAEPTEEAGAAILQQLSIELDAFAAKVGTGDF
jgi:hypothetical protein